MADYLRASSPLTLTLVVGVATILGNFFVKLYRARMLLVDRRRRGLPVAPNHSFLFGHLLYLKPYLDRLPSGAHWQFAMGAIAREEFPGTGGFYIDLWPMSGLLYVVFSPQIGVQITQTNAALHSERPKLLERFFKPITGGPNIFDLPEKEWKPWRLAFNKGFQNNTIMSLVPGMLDQIKVYAEILRGFAEKGDMFCLDPVTLRFTIDMIGKNIINISLDAQKGYNVLADSMLSQIRWHSRNAEINPLSGLDFVTAFMQWKNSRAMDQYIGKELDARYEAYKSDPSTAASKSTIDLVLQAYMAGQTAKSGSSAPPEKLDAEFRTAAIRQIRLFIFAGYDSTSSALCYCFHMLAKHPEVLAKMRAEHDAVLGTDPAAAPEKLTRDPHLVNSLQYTLGVIKEVMRFFPPAASNRAGKAGVNITDDAGNICPTDDAMLHILHTEMHRNARYWRRCEEFLPERWLVGPEDELHPVPGAWRPFELGPRNCIAQGLVLVELRVVLACLVRTFEVKPAYDEWDALHPAKGDKLYRGERAFQVEAGAAHPVDGYPCRITLVRGAWAA